MNGSIEEPWALEYAAKKGSVMIQLRKLRESSRPVIRRSFQRLEASLGMGPTLAQPINGGIVVANNRRALILTMAGVLERATQVTTRYILNRVSSVSCNIN